MSRLLTHHSQFGAEGRHRVGSRSQGLTAALGPADPRLLRRETVPDHELTILRASATVVRHLDPVGLASKDAFAASPSRYADSPSETHC